jgi:fructan beta-fructosidase
MTHKIIGLVLVVLGWSCQPKPLFSPRPTAETHRPQYHFTPLTGWMNDPNGLVYFEGEYHLFYQHYPDSTVWGPMHWGHAVSRDLVHWQHLPIALYPDSIGCIFSGSAVVDSNNTAGFQQGSTPAMVAIFTYHNLDWEKAGRLDRESQGIAYSLDRGRSWTKYAGNPVLPNQGAVDFRDPKVFWHAPTQRWIMPLAVGDFLEIYTSPNLKNWTKASEFGRNEGAHGGVWECPDLFPIRAEDGTSKWILIQNMGRGAVNGGSGTQYFIGQFDGQRFVNDNPPNSVLWLDYGADNYAGITWNGNPDGRRIFIGWMSNWDDYAQTVPTRSWRSGMTIPRTLHLVKGSQGWQLAQRPVAELAQVQHRTFSQKKLAVTGENRLPTQSVAQTLQFEVSNMEPGVTEWGVRLYNSRNEEVKIGCDVRQKKLFVDRTRSGKVDFSAKFPVRHQAPLDLGSSGGNFTCYIDVASVEVFADQGRVVLSELFFPNENFNQLSFYAVGGRVNFSNLTLSAIR